MNYVTLNNGVKMPVMGIGTYLLVPDDAENAVEIALNNGYELIDTANAYVNEKAVGRGMKKSGVSRDKIFLETKLWPSFYEDETAVDETLKRLDTDYIDLMILHQAAGNYIEGYKKLEKGCKEGKIKAIGISNFTIDEIKNLMANSEITPSLIQVEAHPYFPQTELKKFLKEYDIAIQAWFPLGGRDNKSILEDAVIVDLAEKYGKTPAQIILRWHTQMNHVVIPGSKTKAHILDNISIFDFEISEEDMQKIETLDKKQPFFIRSDEMLEQFASWCPDVAGQK